LLPLLQFRLWASLLARKPLTKLAKPLTRWLLTPKQMLTPLLMRPLKLLIRPLTPLLKQLTPLKALLKKLLLTRKKLPNNLSAESIFRFSEGRCRKVPPFSFVCVRAGRLF